MQAYNWYSVPKQVESVKKLLQYDFVHICPGTIPGSPSFMAMHAVYQIRRSHPYLASSPPHLERGKLRNRHACGGAAGFLLPV